MINEARECIPAKLKSPSPPTLALWFAKIEEIRYMEEFTGSLKNTTSQVAATWYYWNEFWNSEEYKAKITGSDLE